MKVGLQLSHNILDVGCARGGLLLQLRREGFVRTVGIDPFLKEDIYYDTGLKILKKNLAELNEEFDLVMLHHSFEHMADPTSVFTQLHHIVKSRGYLLIRTPVIPCFAWRKYGTNWVQLDAPRHLFIHSVRSLNLLSQKAGFVIEHVEFDSKAFQFWGSEQYVRGIPLYDPRSYRVNPGKGLFSNDEIVAFEKRAEELNNVSDGDQACFYLRKI
jgi:2-polyprenyl-3-methyl-5-hydroxy-6-metoxy-1,4-benzoquinol methylase